MVKKKKKNLVILRLLSQKFIFFLHKVTKTQEKGNTDSLTAFKFYWLLISIIEDVKSHVLRQLRVVSFFCVVRLIEK